jgi:hypothetical protein
MSEGERELTTGLLSKDASFRLIVNGPVGVTEIDRLIKKLQIDKEILANEFEEATADRQHICAASEMHQLLLAVERHLETALPDGLLLDEVRAMREKLNGGER